MVSVVIPTLEESECIGKTLERVVGQKGIKEVILADGGSRDATVEIAQSMGASVLSTPRGRGIQLRAGAAHARGDTVWFLHADTLPPADAAEQILGILNDPEVVGGRFSVKFDGADWASSLLTRLYPHMTRLRDCYGDAAIFVRRSVYDAIGGIKPYPIFEDLDLVQRIKQRGRFATISSPVTTSSRRFRQRGFFITSFQWGLLRALYAAGAGPDWLAASYRRVRDITL